jgi:uncharacterized membrane protein YidH (DUF202 family)
MSAKKIVGAVLIVFGLAVFLLGAISWPDRETVIDAGPLQVQTVEQKRVAVPPVVGIVALIGGIILFVLPDRRKA